MARLETGPYKPDPDDWTGVFIRGDDAFGYAVALKDLLDGRGNTDDFWFISRRLSGLYELLRSCDERNANGETTPAPDRG